MSHTDRVAAAPKTLEERFWMKVQKTDQCWLWTGATGYLGYGQLAAGAPSKKRLRATAVSWALHNGPVPAWADLCHRCDTPGCVRPSHLFLGTARDNIRDCINKGRFKNPAPRPGELNNNAKLTWTTVREVRAAYESGATLSALSRRYLCARATLRSVVKGRTWLEPESVGADLACRSRTAVGM